MNIESIKRRLLVKYPFFGSVVANTNFVENSLIETAGTDGNTIYYNPSFINTLNKDQQTFVIAHEVCHIAYDHVMRSKDKNTRLWNIATDAVVNALLKEDGLPMTEGGVDIPEAINYDAEEMYERLLKENEQQENNQNSNNSNSNGQNQQSSNSSQNNNDQNQSEENNDVGHDTHDMWKQAIEKKNQDESKQSNSNKNNETEKNKDIKKLTELGEKESFKQNKIERKKQLEELQQALANQSLGYGNDTNGELRTVNDIGISKPLFDWRRVLKETIKYDVDWSYQNAGIEEGVVTPYLEELPKPETEIVLDTSGSINETLLRNFLRECKNVLKISKVKVGCFDTKFYGFKEIRNEKDIDNLPFYGGGGTDFEVAVNAFSKRIENKIVFTDGYADMPRTKLDVIWIVFGNVKIHPIGGKVIYINNEELRKLYNYQMNTNYKRKIKKL